MTLDKLFYPQTIALIGASDKVGSVGHALFLNLSNQQLYPVNPNLAEISGRRCYQNIGDIPVDIDLAVVAVPAKYVPIVVEEIARKSTKNIIVISSGFKEVGRSDLEDVVRLICQKNSINLLGPNCLGLLNPESKLNATFTDNLPQVGNIAILSQSGALCSSIIDASKTLNLGFSKFVSLGNKTILAENEFLNYLSTDESTSVVGLYTEELVSPSALFNFNKPVIVLKSGRTSAGIAAAKSHTGALSGSDSAYDALFIQSGAIRSDTISDFFDNLQVFSHNPLPLGNHLTIITNAGGVGVLATDAAVKCGLVVDKVNDLLGDANADKYQQALVTNTSDNVMVILTPQSVTEVEKTANVIIEYKKSTQKPLVVCFLGDASISSAVQVLRQNGISTIDYPESAVKSLAALVKYSQFKSRPAPQLFEKFIVTETPDILASFGLPLIYSQVAANPAEAVQIAQKINKPLALKISSPDILHKSDVGGVVLNVDPANITLEFSNLVQHIKTTVPEAKIDGVLIEEMVDRSQGVELILGSFNDPSLGQIIMVGAGGIYTEVLADTAFGVVPITKTDAINLIHSLKVKKILDGLRGKPPLDIDSVVECLGKLSQLLQSHPDIKELDLNPLLVLPKGQGSKVLDYRIISK